MGGTPLGSGQSQKQMDRQKRQLEWLCKEAERQHAQAYLLSVFGASLLYSSPCIKRPSHERHVHGWAGGAWGKEAPSSMALAKPPGHT